MSDQRALRFLVGFIALSLLLGPQSLAGTSGTTADSVNLSPTSWLADYDNFMAQQMIDRERAGVATGKNGAVTVAYNALAARAGLEALKQGGNAMDALLTAAMAQVALTAGAPISYFGIMSLVYYDAETKTVHTMNAEWNTVLAETEPMSIPGGVNMSTPEGLRGRDPSGRTALVGGFMKGVGAAHERFGRLPFDQLFQPSIHIAETGFEISEKMAGYWDMRAEDLARLPETSATLLKPGGKPYVAGDVLKQAALAKTLRAVAEQGVDYMYTGPWAKRLVDAVRAEGGKMTLEDLSRYEVQWRRPIVGKIGDEWRDCNQSVSQQGWGCTHRSPAAGARLRHARRRPLDAVWQGTSQGARPHSALRHRLLAEERPCPDVPRRRLQSERASDARQRQESSGKHAASGKRLMQFEQSPKHSDDVVAIDKDGNIAAITQSINCVLWGKTAIVVDGVTIGDPASFQQMQIARAGPGERLRIAHRDRHPLQER